jgi:hypothetical protein
MRGAVAAGLSGTYAAELARPQAEHRNPGRPSAAENHADGMKLKRGSNQAAYLLRRLALKIVEKLIADDPEVAELIQREVGAAPVAAIPAGFRKAHQDLVHAATNCFRYRAKAAEDLTL